MFVTIAALALVGTIICVAVALRAMAVLGGGVRETLFFFGLAERPVNVPPRRLSAI